MPRLNRVGISTLLVIFFVPAVLCCHSSALRCSLRLAAAAAAAVYFSDRSARPDSARFTPFMIFTMYRQVYAYVKHGRVGIPIFFVVPAVLL